MIPKEREHPVCLLHDSQCEAIDDLKRVGCNSHSGVIEAMTTLKSSVDILFKRVNQKISASVVMWGIGIAITILGIIATISLNGINTTQKTISDQLKRVNTRGKVSQHLIIMHLQESGKMVDLEKIKKETENDD